MERKDSMYEEYEKKLKAARDKAILRCKVELDFWRKIDEREDEVYEHIILRRAARQPTEPQEAGEPRGGATPSGEINL